MSFFVFDIEAYNWNQVYAIGYTDGTNVKILAEKNQKNDYFIEWLLNELPDRSLIYAHNGGKYDFIFILEFLSHQNLKPKSIKLIHASIAELKVEYKKKLLTFRDSILILPGSLKNLTRDFDVEHKKLEMDYNLGIDDERFRNYFTNDLLGLYEVLKKAENLTNKLTIASNAMETFLTKFYKKEVSSNSLLAEKIFREAYLGGRTEVFKLYGKNLKYYDVNSLYPSVMFDFPYPLPEKNNFQKLVDNKELLDDSLFYVKVETPENLKIPVLPLKSEKLIFPLGRFYGWYYSNELKLAKEMGYKIEILKTIKFKTDFIFKDYVSYYYNIKKTTKNPSEKAIAKLFLNSLYGKFGERRVREVFKIENSTDHVNTLFPIIEKKYVDKWSKFIHPEIAGMITSNARVRLYQLFLRAGLENIYYCDTDSIMTDKELPTSNELGDIKKEDDIIEYIGLLPKVYAYRNVKGEVVIKAKGFNSKKLQFSYFEDALFKNDFSKFIDERERLKTFKEYYHRKNSFEYAENIKLLKQIRKSYDKRIILDNFDTIPLKVFEF